MKFEDSVVTRSGDNSGTPDRRGVSRTTDGTPLWSGGILGTRYASLIDRPFQMRIHLTNGTRQDPNGDEHLQSPSREDSRALLRASLGRSLRSLPRCGAYCGVLRPHGCPFESHPPRTAPQPHASPASLLARKRARDSLGHAPRTLRTLGGARHPAVSVSSRSSRRISRFLPRPTERRFSRGREARP